MKTRLLAIVVVLVFSVSSLTAQYCGNSGSSVCTSTNSVQVGFIIPSEDIPCISRGQNTALSIDVRNYDTLTFNGITLQIDSMRIDTITNLPQGLCWASNKVDNKYLRGEHGCIKITGTTNALQGQYKLKMLLTYWTNIGVIGPGVDLEATADRVFLRVKNLSSSCPQLDTTQVDPWIPGENVDDFAHISGKVFRDENTNGVFDNGELAFRNIRVNIGSTPAITNASGNYHAYVEPGTYTVTAIGVESGAISFPGGSQTVNATTAGQDYPGVNFFVVIPPGYCEAEMSMVNWAMPPRPGFDNTLQLQVANTLSLSPLTFTLRLYYNSSQTYVSSSVAENGTGSNYVEWNVSNLTTGNTWVSNVVFNSPTTLQLGSVISYSAVAQGLSCANMDTSIRYELTVVGSYDPNDKAVSPIGYSDHHGINPTQVDELTYKIRFQNTGTFLAEKVVVVDTISQHLDITTLKVQSASHNYDVAIGDDRAVKFIFNQIMLPDSNSNEPESHGYVQYSIKLNPSLSQNTPITNKADIYFDFNSPIRTNTAYNTIDFTTTIKEVTNAYNFSLFPNPATNSVQITADEQLVGKPLKVTDLSGRILLQRIVDAPVMTIELSALANGVYLMQVEGATKKLVKE